MRDIFVEFSVQDLEYIPNADIYAVPVPDTCISCPELLPETCRGTGLATINQPPTAKSSASRIEKVST